MVLCSICGRKNECMLYTIFMSNYKEKYLKLKKVQQKRAFIKENYKEYCHIGCIVFYLSLVSIVQEKYYVTQDKCLTDFIFFGLENIHKSKHQVIECSICDKGLGNVSAPEKKASISCGNTNCKNQYHVDCIIQIRKRVNCTKARLNYYCNKHFDKNELIADWDNWNSIAMNLVIENVSIRQEEQYQGDQKCIVVSVDDPNDVEGIKLDQKSFKRLDEELIKKQKTQRRETQVEAEKKRQKFWDISKDFKSQYEFGPRPIFSIDYSAKKKDEMIMNQEEIDYPLQKKVFKEEIVITDEGVHINKYERPSKPKIPQQSKVQQQKIQSSKKIDDDSYKNLKTEHIDLDIEIKLIDSPPQDNEQVSLDQLLLFVREKKNSIPVNSSNGIDEKKGKQNNAESKNLEQKQNQQNETQFENTQLNTNGEKQNKKQTLPKQPFITAVPNADMVDNTDKKDKKSKQQLNDYSTMSATELLNFLTKNQEQTSTQNRQRNRRKNDTTRAIQQKQELIYYPIPDEAWEENIQDFWGKIEDNYFTPKKDIYTIVEDFRKFDVQEIKNLIRVLYEFKEEGIILAEYRLDEDENYEQLYKDDIEMKKYKIYRPSLNSRKTLDDLEIYENDQFPKLVLENLQPIDQSNQPTQEIWEQFQEKKDSSIYNEQHLEQFYSSQLDQLIQQNQVQIKQLNSFLMKERANLSIYRQGKLYVDKLRHFELLKNTILGMKQITDEEHQLTIKKKVELLTTLRTENFAGKCNLNCLKQSQKEELANETCCKICFNYQLVQIESNNDLTYCGQCWNTFHKNCYNMQEGFENCDTCRIPLNQPIQQIECYLCKKNYVGIPLRQVEGFWIHITCALLSGLLEFNQSSFKMKKGIMQQSQQCCLICEEKEGYKIQCQECTNSVHILCAYFWGLFIHVKTEPECIDPYIFTTFLCPNHYFYNEQDLTQQIYYRWHGVNYNQAANFENYEIFMKGKLIAHQKTIAKILQQQ